MNLKFNYHDFIASLFHHIYGIIKSKYFLEKYTEKLKN